MLLLAPLTFAQSVQTGNPYEMYLDVDGYVNAKIREMRQQGKRVTYDDQQTLEERKKTLAKNYANLAASNPDLKGEDLYYLGLLLFIGEDINRSYPVMKSFLSQYPADAKGELVQLARTYCLIMALRKKLADEAESYYQAWVSSEPFVKTRQPMMENILAVALFKDQQYAKAIHYGQEAFDLLKTFQPKTIKDKRDIEQLYANMLEVLALSYKKDKKNDLALNILAEARARSFTIPSANLYREVMKFVESSSFSEKKLMQKIESYATANPAPELEMMDWIGQEPIKFEELRGKVVLLDFWATWCGPCRTELPLFQKTMEKYQTDPGVAFLAISTDEDRELVQPYLNNNDYKLPVVFADRIDEHFSVSSIPTTIILNPRGEVVFRMRGFNPNEDFLVRLSEKIEAARR